MTQPINVKVYDQSKLVYEAQVDGPAEFGRQNPGEAAPYSHRQADGVDRFIIARLDEAMISRKHLLLKPGANGRVTLTNQGKIPIRVHPDGSLGTGATSEVELPVTLTIGTRSLRFQAPVEEPSFLNSLADAALAPGRPLDVSRAYASRALSKVASGTVDPEALAQWMQATMGVLQSATGTLDFFAKAARAVVDLVGLDSGRVLLREDGRWVVRVVETSRPGPADREWVPSRQVLGKVQADKKTYWQVPDLANANASLMDVRAVVAAPILDRAGEVIGVLYGERRTGPAARTIDRLEGLLVEMLACGVAAGLARVEQEEVAVRAQYQMEQFFTPELSRYLFEHPEALQARDCEVTMMSCDIRGFSRICESLGPTRTLEWLNDVLGVLSDCILAEQGVLVDYVGDELMAMWGAPIAQPDHAARAGRAALNMLDKVSTLNDRWSSTISGAMGLGIGISSGQARVGNVGSRVKFKYGALGNTVNLASRVQGATKYLKVPLLVTGATQQQLDTASFAARRLCQVKVVNIVEPVTLYEVVRPGREHWAELRQGYEEALALVERQEFRAAARITGGLIAQPAYREDGPALILLQRAVNGLVGGAVSAVWELPGK